MDNIALAFGVVFPLFLLTALGYFLRSIKLIDQHTVNVANDLIFNLFLPVMLFYNIYKSNFEQSFDGKLLLYSVVAGLILFTIIFASIMILEKDNNNRGPLIQGIFRGNFILYAIIITTLLSGTEYAGVAALVVAVIVPIYNLLCVVTLEFFKREKPNIIAMARGVVTNPLIIASVLGILIQIFKIKFPSLAQTFFSSASFIGKPFETFISNVSSLATPLAFIILGASFKFFHARQYFKQITIGTVSKLVVVPLLCLLPAVWLGFDKGEIGVLVAVFCSPTAVSTFNMVKKFGANEDLAAQLVVFTTCFSMITLFAWILIFRSLGFI